MFLVDWFYGILTSLGEWWIFAPSLARACEPWLFCQPELLTILSSPPCVVHPPFYKVPLPSCRATSPRRSARAFPLRRKPRERPSRNLPCLVAPCRARRSQPLVRRIAEAGTAQLVFCTSNSTCHATRQTGLAPGVSFRFTAVS